MIEGLAHLILLLLTVYIAVFLLPTRLFTSFDLTREVGRRWEFCQHAASSLVETAESSLLFIFDGERAEVETC